MKRFLDILIVSVAIVAGAPIIFAIAAAVKITSRGSVLYWSDRVGRDNCIFRMPKFRTMRTDTPELPTHLLTNSDHWITPFGQILRSTSLDELPQLWTVLNGQMSLVGPRPSLFNQHDLIRLRSLSGVHRLTPGVTGWAQINGRDELEIDVKVRFDEEYVSRQSRAFDARIIFLTAFKVLRRDGIQQAGSDSAEIAGRHHKAA